jgi:hypothetical protein
MKSRTSSTVSAGFACGNSTRQSVVQLLAPSTFAASTSAEGTLVKNDRSQNVPNDTERAICGRIRAQ